jgi:hypothetical protein
LFVLMGSKQLQEQKQGAPGTKLQLLRW